MHIIQNLCFRDLILLPDILEPHEPTSYKASYRRSSRQVKHPIDAFRIRHQHTRQLASLDKFPKSSRPGIDDGLRIDRGCILGNLGLKAIGVDGGRESKEQGSNERLAEHDERHGDRDLDGSEIVLNGNDGLGRKISDWWLTL
jgi:hypothetical protein